MDCGMDGRTVLVTGGSAGIGRATVMAYGKEPGVKIALSYHRNGEAASEVLAQLEEAGVQGMAVRMDLEDIGGIEAAFAEVAERFGGVDVLVANAVQWPTGRYPFEDAPIEAWRSFFLENLLGTVRLCQLAVGGMKERNWGRIVLLSSDLARDSMKGSGRYSALKASLSGLAANLVAELSPYGILTNLVLPSWTLTDRARSAFPESFREAAKEAFPTGRITEPEDVASLVVYLGSAANAHVNGESVRVTGGCSLALMNHLWEAAGNVSA